MGEILRAEVTATVPRRLAALALRPAFRAMRRRLDYAETGGAPLLGVDGAVVIAHGRSNETAIANAVGVAKRGAEGEVAATIGRLLGADGVAAATPTGAGATGA
jgi:glycerol-3-phosphate acyltransferase PlsX